MQVPPDGAVCDRNITQGVLWLRFDDEALCPGACRSTNTLRLLQKAPFRLYMEKLLNQHRFGCPLHPFSCALKADCASETPCGNFMSSRQHPLHMSEAKDQMTRLSLASVCSALCIGASRVQRHYCSRIAHCRIDNRHQAARRFLEAVCRTADGLTVNVAMVGALSPAVKFHASNSHARSYCNPEQDVLCITKVTLCGIHCGRSHQKRINFWSAVQKDSDSVVLSQKQSSCMRCLAP